MALPRLFRPFHSVHKQYSHDLVKSWYKTELGVQTLASEKAVLDQLLPELFGYHLMQVGVINSPQLTSSSPIKHQFFVNELQDEGSSCSPKMVISKATELAIASDSIDVAVLHHSLDFHDNPHGILREISRTVMPGGKIVIVGFNPWSWWGAFRTFLKNASNSSRAPWDGNFLSLYRVSDWLNLLDFEIDGCECVCYGLPSVNPKASKAFSWIGSLAKRWLSQTGAVYTVVATKRVATFTPIKPKRFNAPSLVPLPLNGLVRPASRNPVSRRDHRD
ncbi:hypothetical protein A9Q99_26625 [Gammaproteobacteria bacterium 45_16_T64]|mgnify:CR=1 FL=1|nr:hypothetical protein A9Q99_26625 [Gammaproteobacteria bacterium 45_16_T64]